MLKFVSLLLAEIYPEHVSQPPHDLIKQVHHASKTRSSKDYYLRLDIKNYFPSIDHQILMRMLRRRIRQKEFLHLIYNSLVTPTGRKKGPETLSREGVPQGLSVANILSSLYLSDVDAKFKKTPNVNYFRFVDDLLVISDQTTVRALTKSLPRELKVRKKIVCHEIGTYGKSECVPLSQGIDYLGYSFRLGKVKVRDMSFEKMFVNLMKLFTAMKYGRQKTELVWRMNLRISGCIFEEKKIGWMFFFIQSNNLHQLKRLDAFVATQAKHVLSSEDCERLKKFVRSYYEIRYEYRDSKYFPNFDTFGDEQKKAQIRILHPHKASAEIEKLNEEELNDLFRSCISKEVRELERDMMDVFS